MITTSEQIWDTLQKIKNTSGQIAKRDMFAEAMKEPQFMEMVRLATDPMITFGIAGKTLTAAEKNWGSGSGAFLFEHSTTYNGHFGILDRLEEFSSRKRTGNAAKDSIAGFRRNLTHNSWSLLRLVLQKDLDCGISAKTVAEMFPGLIFSFDVMLAHSFEEKRIKSWPVAVEPKYDGMRAICVVKKNETRFFTRSGKPINTVDHIGDVIRFHLGEAMIADGLVLDGEIEAESFAKTMSQARKKNEIATDAIFQIFDVLYLDEWERRISPTYEVRRNRLQVIANLAKEAECVKIVPRYLARNVREVESFYKSFRARKLEGAIVKSLDGKYEWSRSYSWLKMKETLSFDLPIIGFFEGEGKYQDTLGGVIVDYFSVDVKVGGGFTDEERNIIWENKAFYHGKVMEVAAQEVTPDGSLRHPRCIGLRIDLEAGDIAA